MPAEPVACVGDVVAIVGLGVPPEADSGTWTPGTITPTPIAQISAEGAQVIYAATCIFTGAGLKSGNAVTYAPSTVTLTASQTVLQGGLTNVLRNGDSASDSYGNTLKIVSTRTLKSG